LDPYNLDKILRLIADDKLDPRTFTPVALSNHPRIHAVHHEFQRDVEKFSDILYHCPVFQKRSFELKPPTGQGPCRACLPSHKTVWRAHPDRRWDVVAWLIFLKALNPLYSNNEIDQAALEQHPEDGSIASPLHEMEKTAAPHPDKEEDISPDDRTWDRCRTERRAPPSTTGPWKSRSWILSAKQQGNSEERLRANLENNSVRITWIGGNREAL